MWSLNEINMYWKQLPWTIIGICGYQLQYPCRKAYIKEKQQSLYFTVAAFLLPDSESIKEGYDPCPQGIYGLIG